MQSQAFIYIIHAEESLFVKIGISADVSVRMRDMQVGCPLRLALVFSFPASLYPGNPERKLHQAFEEYHHHGEWFKIPFATDYPQLVREVEERLRLSFAPRPKGLHIYQDGKFVPKPGASLHLIEGLPLLIESIRQDYHYWRDKPLFVREILQRLELVGHTSTPKDIRKACNALVRHGELSRISKNTYALSQWKARQVEKGA